MSRGIVAATDTRNGTGRGHRARQVDDASEMTPLSWLSPSSGLAFSSRRRGTSQLTLRVSAIHSVGAAYVSRLVSSMTRSDETHPESLRSSDSQVRDVDRVKRDAVASRDASLQVNNS